MPRRSSTSMGITLKHTNVFRCPDPLDCEDGLKVWNYSTCECECEETDDCDPVIGGDRVWNPSTCECDCVDNLECDVGFYFNTATCQCEECEEVECDEGQVFELATCSCVDE